MKNILNLFDDFIGLTVDVAMSKIPESDIKTIRATNIDGKPIVGIRDYRKDRLNVHINNGVIVKISSIG